jgi:hypothetical protein
VTQKYSVSQGGEGFERFKISIKSNTYFSFHLFKIGVFLPHFSRIGISHGQQGPLLFYQVMVYLLQPTFTAHHQRKPIEKKIKLRTK